jgi:hypothetical protein
MAADSGKVTARTRPSFRRARAAGFALLALVALLAAWAGWTRYSIVARDVAFRSGDLVLRGTLLTPRFGKAAPGVVLVHGSGRTSRKSMLPYAWIFAAKGYAALAYDKRGVGGSQGAPDAWSRFSFDALAQDAAAAYRFVQAQPRVDARRVGFFGASQGAWVVSEAGNRVQPPAFLILASASFSTLAEDRLDGRLARLRQLGFGHADVALALALIRQD